MRLFSCLLICWKCLLAYLYSWNNLLDLLFPPRFVKVLKVFLRCCQVWVFRPEGLTFLEVLAGSFESRVSSADLTRRSEYSWHLKLDSTKNSWFLTSCSFAYTISGKLSFFSKMSLTFPAAFPDTIWHIRGPLLLLLLTFTYKSLYSHFIPELLRFVKKPDRPK